MNKDHIRQQVQQWNRERKRELDDLLYEHGEKYYELMLRIHRQCEGEGGHGWIKTFDPHLQKCQWCSMLKDV